jgi:amidase
VDPWLTGDADAAETATAVRSGFVTAREVVEAAIVRAEAANRRLSFLVTERFEQAAEEAASLGAAGPLAGVPVLTKDFLATVAGLPQTEGSSFIREWIADHDSEYVARLRRAGAIVIGTTTTSEMALLSTCETARFGVTHNPAAPGRTTGGSSGGSASAVAARVVPAAHGSDAGGSIRIPASCCGLIGLKPTRARNPLGPDHGDVAAGLWVEHVLTRSVRDSALFLDVTHGPALGDPYAAPAPRGLFRDAVSHAPSRQRVAVTVDTLDGRKSAPECIRAVERTAAALVDLGHDVVEGAPCVEVRQAEADFFLLLCAGLAARVEMWSRRLGRQPCGDDLEPYTWGLLEKGRAVSGVQLLDAIDRLQHCARDVARFYEKVDIWLTPTLGTPPVPLGYFEIGDDETPDDVLDRDARFTPFLWIANMTGQPALSYPAYRDADGVPIGVQLSARVGDEETLLAVAAQLEQAISGTSPLQPASSATTFDEGAESASRLPSPRRPKET